MTEFTPEWIAKARNACILFGEPATTEFRKALDHIERLQKRIEELEAERLWIHQDNTMIVKKDCDSWCFVLPDFVNLQESEAEFVEGILYRFIEDIHKRLLPPKEEE